MTAAPDCSAARDPRAADPTNIAGLAVDLVNRGGRNYLAVEIAHIFGGPTQLLLDAGSCDELTRRLHQGRTALRNAERDA